MAKMGVAIIGEGWVGKSMVELFPAATVFDEPKINQAEYQNRYAREQALNRGRAAVNAAEVAFVCVPTPETVSGELDTSIVESVVDWVKSDLIVLRSTVNPGTTDRLKQKTGKRIVMQPEYLGETPSHPMLHPSERPFMVIGGEAQDRRKLINLYTTVMNANVKIRQVSALEAEVIKLSENRAIAFKVAQCQELYDACEAAGIDYYTIRDAVYGDDPRFDLWFSYVYPDNRGFHSSKCLRKDVPAWNAWAESLGVKPKVTAAIVERSAEYERGEQ